jgi:hypothetical protein
MEEAAKFADSRIRSVEERIRLKDENVKLDLNRWDGIANFRLIGKGEPGPRAWLSVMRRRGSLFPEIVAGTPRAWNVRCFELSAAIAAMEKAATEPEVHGRFLD